jgi:hypothetical protein
MTLFKLQFRWHGNGNWTDSSCYSERNCNSIYEYMQYVDSRSPPAINRMYRLMMFDPNHQIWIVLQMATILSMLKYYNFNPKPNFEIET